MLFINKKKSFNTRKKKYNYRFLLKKRNSILKESDLQKKHLQTLSLAFQILKDIFSLDLFGQTESESRIQAKILVFIILSWSFKPNQIPNTLKLLMSCLTISKFNDYNSLIQKKKIGKISKFLLGIALTMLLTYNSLFNVPKLRKDNKELLYIPTTIEILDWRYQKSLPILNQQNIYLQKNAFSYVYGNLESEIFRNNQPLLLMHDFDTISKPGKRLSVHSFDPNKQLKANFKQIPLSKRTGTLEKLNKQKEEQIAQRFEKIKRTVQFECIIKTQNLYSICYISNKEKVDFEKIIQQKSYSVTTEFMIQKNRYVISIFGKKFNQNINSFKYQGFIVKDSNSNLLILCNHSILILTKNFFK